MEYIAIPTTWHSYARRESYHRFYDPGTGAGSVVWWFTIARHSHKEPSDPAASRTGTIITGTDLNAGAYPHQAQVHASRKRYSGRQRQELATVVWRLLRFLLLGGGMA